MRKYYLLNITLLSLFLFSCSKKDIQLPLIESDGISEIYNHSSIWLFFKEDGKDTLATLNKNNKIINTHWILNIDRRLPMKKVAPILLKMQTLKNKPSMHSKGGTYLYYSFANTKSNKISLFEFKPTNFVLTSNHIIDTIHKSPSIKINLQKDHILINQTTTNLKQLKSILEDYKNKDTLNNSKITLDYNGNISYQKYLQTKMLLSKINIAIDSTENIYSLK